MIPFIKVILVSMTRFLLRLFVLFPIKKNTLVFYSYNGKFYGCNPKYIYIYLKERFENELNLIWVLNDTDHLHRDLDGITLVKFKSVKYYYYMLTSRVIINNGIAPSYLPFRKQQCVIGTWHGGGSYKKGGLDANNEWYIRYVTKRVAQNVTYVISSCKAFTEALATGFLIDEKKVLPIGMPRNDLFFHHNEETIGNIKQKLQITEEKIVLYAPTFRSNLKGIESDFRNSNNRFDYEGLILALEEKFGGKWVILFRNHYYLESGDIPKYVRDVSDYDDMQELLLISDVLINDYSSSMWDFSLMKKPCFIYAEDIVEYESTRGFYTSMNKWPFPVAVSNAGLFQNIKDFDQEKYIKLVEQHHHDLGSYESGQASQKIGNMLVKMCTENKQ